MTGELVARSSLGERMEYARALAEASLLPPHYRKQPANVLYAVEYGAMLGLPPLASITGINIIDGKPTASAGLISALVRRAGHRLRVRTEEDGQGRPSAVAEIVRADDPQFTYRSLWTVDRAERAGLCRVVDGRIVARSQNGRVLPWEAYTEALLKARAVTEVARDACEEALSGVRCSPEELGADVDGDGDPMSVTVVQEQAAPAAAAPAVETPSTAASPTDTGASGPEVPAAVEALVHDALHASDVDTLRELYRGAPEGLRAQPVADVVPDIAAAVLPDGATATLGALLMACAAHVSETGHGVLREPAPLSVEAPLIDPDVDPWAAPQTTDAIADSGVVDAEVVDTEQAAP